MRVLLVSFSDNADHQDTLFGLYEQLFNRIDISLMAIKHPKVSVPNLPNIQLVDCPKRPGICKKTFDFITLKKIISYIRHCKFDVIYFESLHVWNLVIMLFCKKNIKKFHVIHEVIPHEGDRQEKLVHQMNKFISMLADVVVLHNKKYIKTMQERYSMKYKCIKFIELWRRFPTFSKPVYSKKVLFFGRLNPYKGINNLLEITRRCPNIQFDVIGRVDPQVQGIVNALYDEKNVVLNNTYVTDKEMEEAFLNSDWIILPYNSASQSGVIIDAYKYSRPVIAFNVGAIYEQIIHGKTGFLVEAGNIDKFCLTLNDALNMEDKKYKLMCENAYLFGEQKYSSKKAADEFIKLICKE